MPIKTRTIWVPREDQDLAGVNSFLQGITAAQFISMAPQPAADGMRQVTIVYEDELPPEIVSSSIHNGACLHEDYLPTTITLVMSSPLVEDLPDGSFTWIYGTTEAPVLTNDILFQDDEVTLSLPSLTGYEGSVALVALDLESRSGIPARSALVTEFRILSRDKFPTAEIPNTYTKPKETRYGTMRVSRLLVSHASGTPEQMIEWFKRQHQILDDQIVSIIHQSSELAGYTDVYIAWFTQLAPRPLAISPLPGASLASETALDKIILTFDSPVENLTTDDVEIEGNLSSYSLSSMSVDKTAWEVNLTGVGAGHLLMFLNIPDRHGDRRGLRRLYSWHVAPRTVSDTGSGDMFRATYDPDHDGVVNAADVAHGLQETSGPTTLTMGSVADGQTLKRSGTTVVGYSQPEALITDTLANILAMTPVAGSRAYATDIAQEMFYNGSAWYVSSAYADVIGPSPDMGSVVGSNRAGYGRDYVTKKTLSRCKIGQTADDEQGAIKQDGATTVSMYLAGVWRSIVNGIDLREDPDGSGALEHRPVGSTIWVTVFSGNSIHNLGLNGIPIVQGYKASMGAYPVPATINGGTCT